MRVAIALMMCAGTAHAEAPDEVICPRVAEAPVIDGVPDEACWMEAARVWGFTEPLSEAAPAKATAARVCFDDSALYLAFECAEPQPGSLRLQARPGSEDVWQDDCVEVWLGAGASQLEFDQFIVNAAGITQSLRSRPGVRGPVPGEWSAAAKVGADRWTVEMAVPFATLELQAPTRGTLIRMKLGREDHAGGGSRLATWPPKSTYGGAESPGRLYLETANLLANPDMSQQQDGKIASWGWGQEDVGLFSSVEDQGRAVIRFAAPGRYSVAQQGLRLQPDALYRLDARVRGAAGIYLRARTARRKGEDTTAYSVYSRPSETYQKLELTFPTGETGEALIIIGNTQDQGAGEVFVADLRIAQEVSFDADGPAIPLPPDKPVVVKKLLAADCRALRGFVAAPVDGRLDSYDWDVNVWEYGMGGAGAGVGYSYRNNDGLHITLADDGGVDAVIIRQGARVKLYRDAERYDDPAKAPLLCDFKGRAKTSRMLFGERVKSRRFSFFDLQDGRIADCSFLRIGGEVPGQANTVMMAGNEVDPGDLRPALERRFGEEDRTTHDLSHGEAPIKAPAKHAIHLVSAPEDEPLWLTGIALHLSVPDAPSGCPLTVAIQDPLNPRQELMGVDFTLEGPGDLQPVLDFPDQVIPDGKRLWLTLTFGAPVTLESAAVEVRTVPLEEALPEALAFRKFVMKGLFAELSEARQWTTFRRDTDFDKFRRENHWGEGVMELAETIAQCKALGPEDDTVRCYDEWFWRTARDLPPFEPKIDDIPGAPEWAVVARQAWLTAREVPKWWIDHRLVPTGEFGGLVGDDSDMYQNYADFPMFERDGVAAEIMAGAANLAELAEIETMEAGLNRRTMDPLHAYEEGVNHEALMLWWNYGDPVYFERCLQAAKSMPALTVMTDKGHRHFKNQDCGAEDLRINRDLGVDGHAHPLMLHPCFEVAWYNGSPKVVQFLREWADGWLEHQQPGAYATSVDVKTEEATETSQRALYGGYGGQACAHNFLWWLTDDVKYIQPFMDFWTRGEDAWPARRYVPEAYQRGGLDGVEKRESALAGNPVTKAIALGDRQALIEALKRDIAELQRFRTMYTDAEVFTDRVFLDAITNATLCYTGGFATRNKYNQTHAVSWEGFGTDYAALVLTARRDHFKALVYNFRNTPSEGAVRFWTLDHGRYQLALGPDADGNDVADNVQRQETLEIMRATAVPLSLPPKTVMVLELTQTEKLDDIRERPDLAITEREIEVKDGVVSGVIHNIGGGDAPAFEVALADAAGKVVARQTLGPLAAPVDLEPKRVAFRFEGVPDNTGGWRVVLDPEGRIAEVYEGNNEGGVR
ncbi:MAG: hypothetical protein FJX75_15910 [Armatimonadetes bacterium]|nr:hypothetical protein [Armatimonadota bacterium]